MSINFALVEGHFVDDAAAYEMFSMSPSTTIEASETLSSDVELSDRRRA